MGRYELSFRSWTFSQLMICEMFIWSKRLWSERSKRKRKGKTHFRFFWSSNILVYQLWPRRCRDSVVKTAPNFIFIEVQTWPNKGLESHSMIKHYPQGSSIKTDIENDWSNKLFDRCQNEMTHIIKKRLIIMLSLIFLRKG